MCITRKLLRIEAVSEKTTLAKSTIWQKIARNEFPRGSKLPSSSITVWEESAINEWIDNLFNAEKGVKNV